MMRAINNPMERTMTPFFDRVFSIGGIKAQHEIVGLESKTL